MQLWFQKVYLLLLTMTFYVPGCLAGISLFSDNSTLAAAYKVIENAIESVDLSDIVQNLLNKAANPDQFLSAVNVI